VFESGIFNLDAHYYLAQACVKVKDSICALSHFQKVTDLNNKHLEPSYLYLARRYFSINNFEKSNESYLNLEKIATSNSVKREAIIRLMLGFETGENEQSENVVIYANKVLNLDKLDDGLKNKASIILARSYFTHGNFQKAEKTFSSLSENAIDRVGAEATYMMAYLNYLNDSLQRSETIIYQLANDFTADYWPIGKLWFQTFANYRSNNLGRPSYKLPLLQPYLLHFRLMKKKFFLPFGNYHV
jgi:tetratricopeptide (TPR) repeat protein